MPLINDVLCLPLITTLTYCQRLNDQDVVAGQWHFQSAIRPALLPTDVGVYFLVFDDRIYKVGKATGELGMQGRIRKYETYYSPKQTDKSVIRWFQQMQGNGNGPLLGVKLDVRFFAFAPVNLEIPWPGGPFQLPAHAVDALETHFRNWGINEHHQLLLERNWRQA